MYTEQFTETHDVLDTLPPTAANAAVGVHGTQYVSLADYHRAFVWVDLGEATQGATLDVEIWQATSAAGAGAVIMAAKSPVQSVAANQGNHIGIEVRSEELNVSAGFVFLQARVDVGGQGPFYYDLVIFGIVSRYEAVGVADFQEVVP